MGTMQKDCGNSAEIPREQCDCGNSANNAEGLRQQCGDTELYSPCTMILSLSILHKIQYQQNYSGVLLISHTNEEF